MRLVSTGPVTPLRPPQSMISACHKHSVQVTHSLPTLSGTKNSVLCNNEIYASIFWAYCCQKGSLQKWSVTQRWNSCRFASYKRPCSVSSRQPCTELIGLDLPDTFRGPWTSNLLFPTELVDWHLVALWLLQAMHRTRYSWVVPQASSLGMTQMRQEGADCASFSVLPCRSNCPAFCACLGAVWRGWEKRWAAVHCLADLTIP